jgi:large subunit ribosomal protein L28
MSRCELTGKGPVVKNLVSHSNIKTKSIAQPNIQKKRIFSRTLNQMVRLQIATSAIRDMEHTGGFDNFILNQDDKGLSKRALAVKLKIKKKIGSSKK